MHELQKAASGLPGVPVNGYQHENYNSGIPGLVIKHQSQHSNRSHTHLARNAIRKTSNVILGLSLGHNKALEQRLPRKETVLKLHPTRAV